MTRVRAASVPWAMARLALGPGSLGSVPGMRFARVLGSGRDGGFGLRPGLDCQGVFATFDRVEEALEFATASPAIARYRDRALEQVVAVLSATQARGAWSGATLSPDPDADPPGPGMPVAALTRAAIRPRQALRFWRHSPPTERALAGSPGCRLAVGLGEAPFLRQATFSLWDDVASMDAYARRGAHQRAIDASWQGQYFSEWMFVRFQVRHLEGRWAGRDLQPFNQGEGHG